MPQSRTLLPAALKSNSEVIFGVEGWRLSHHKGLFVVLPNPHLPWLRLLSPTVLKRLGDGLDQLSDWWWHSGSQLPLYMAQRHVGSRSR
jgi:hypothetical protein